MTSGARPVIASPAERAVAPSHAASRSLLASGALLVAVNLIPLAGVLLGGWDVFRVLTLFWAENLVIGAFAVLRLLLVERRLVPALFFAVHFGGFCAGHGLLLTHLFGPADAPGPADALLDALLATGPLLTVAALVASHLWSFVTNTLGQREYHVLTAATAMRIPYQRVFITQIALILGAGLVQRFDEPLLGLLTLIVVKTAFDFRAHRREHRALAGQHAPRGF